MTLPKVGIQSARLPEVKLGGVSWVEGEGGGHEPHYGGHWLWDDGSHILWDDGSFISLMGPKPYDTEVEYLESSGNQWINTGYIPKGQDNDIYCSFMPLAILESNGALFAAFTAGGYNCYRALLMPNEVISVWNGDEALDAGASTKCTLEDKHTLLVKRDSIFEFDGQQIQMGKHISKENEEPLYLFRNTPTSSGNLRPLVGRIYYFKWVKGDNVILDLIPVSKDGEGYMYDRVSGKMFGNSGSGKFILGPAVVRYKGTPTPIVADVANGE